MDTGVMTVKSGYPDISEGPFKTYLIPSFGNLGPTDKESITKYKYRIQNSKFKIQRVCPV